MTGACILVFGVSGVGKSRACSDYVDRNPEWLHLRAGELLSRLTGESPENLRTALDEEVVANQGLLSLAVTRARAGREHRPVLVDCHAVIDNDDGLVVVPAGTVVALAPDGLILLEHDAAEVSMRRIIDLRVRPSREPARDRGARPCSSVIRSKVTPPRLPCRLLSPARRLASDLMHPLTRCSLGAFLETHVDQVRVFLACPSVRRRELSCSRVQTPQGPNRSLPLLAGAVPRHRS